MRTPPWEMSPARLTVWRMVRDMKIERDLPPVPAGTGWTTLEVIAPVQAIEMIEIANNI